MRRVLLLAVVAVLSATAVAGWCAKEQTSTERVAGVPLAGYVEYAGSRMCFDTQIGPIPPVPEGGVVSFSVVPIVTDFSKSVDVWVTLGTSRPRALYADTPGLGQRGKSKTPQWQQPIDQIDYCPDPERVPQIVVNLRYNGAVRSSAPLIWVFGATVSHADSRYVVRYPIRVISRSEWDAAQAEFVASDAEQTDRAQHVESQNAAIAARNRASMETFERDLAAWSALPRTKTEEYSVGERKLDRGVIRFRRGEAIAADFNGGWRVLDALSNEVVDQGQVADGQTFVSGSIVGHGVVIEAWRGAGIPVRYGPVTMGEGGVIDVKWTQSTAALRPPDRPRLEMTPSRWDKVCERRQEVIAQAQAIGISRQDIEAAIRQGPDYARSIRPGEIYDLVMGSPSQVWRKWNPTSCHSCAWLSLPSGSQYAVFEMADCLNLGGALLTEEVPVVVPLEPAYSTSQVLCTRTVPCEVGPAPQKPELEPLLEPVVQASLSMAERPDRMEASSDVSLRSVTFNPPVLWVWWRAIERICPPKTCGPPGPGDVPTPPSPGDAASGDPGWVTPAG